MEKRRMRSAVTRNVKQIRLVILAPLAIAALAIVSAHLYADEPYARNRQYDLQHSRIALRFDVQQKKVVGDVTHTLAILHDTSKIEFDSVGLNIQNVSVTKARTKFETTA